MGTLHRVAENNQSIKYSGYCFFGNADYVVSKNKDLINIWNSERKVYIYNRETPSSGTSNSFYGNIVCLYAPKEVAAPTTDPSNNQIINNPSSTKSSHSSHDLECKACYGSGKCSYCGGRGWKIIEDTVQDCIICHGSGRCQSCHGKGKIHSYWFPYLGTWKIEVSFLGASWIRDCSPFALFNIEVIRLKHKYTLFGDDTILKNVVILIIVLFPKPTKSSHSFLGGVPRVAPWLSIHWGEDSPNPFRRPMASER